MKTVVVFGGRFQPPHRGHKASYDYLVKKFPNADVYVSSADKASGPKDPFTWQEKKSLAASIGIPSAKFVNIKNAYNETFIREALHYDPKDTVLIIALSEKDGDRLVRGPKDSAGYALKKDGHRAPIQWLSENPQVVAKGHFYVVATPTVTFPVTGKKTSSASQIRSMYGTANNKMRDQIISDLYGQSIPATRMLFDKRLAPQVTETLLREYVEYINKI